ncbi:type I-E CRISPR-associated protein Cse1/CasA [Levilactobacillus zymae]|uniref:type I-E CRISPR-associated protein Cse1/CasA n=1 Tax=Levilactobacillus zymae TaxID=267363 RepID=UPI003FCD39F9
MKQTFNLTTAPWIRVFNSRTNREEEVSLITLFEHAADYRQLAGEMRAQDLAILRLLLAILTTVYSRVDVANQAYPWFKAATEIKHRWSSREQNKYLLKTWQRLYQDGHFSEAVTIYLHHWADRFDFFGEHPFYQVTLADYNALVIDKNRITEKKRGGQVAVRQLNRRISESGNSKAVFSPKAETAKNEAALDELVRWLIMYQNYTGVTDKSVVKSAKKFAKSTGWLYELNPVIAKGDSLFETLMLNLVLTNYGKAAKQCPVWEYETVQAYIADRQAQQVPDNLAELYTTWSRILYVEWDEANHPTIFSAGIPIFSKNEVFLEPMTTWRIAKSGDLAGKFVPSRRALGFLDKAMWRNFGQYVSLNQEDTVHEPRLVTWLRQLQAQEVIPWEKHINLMSINLVPDDNKSSQLPSAEVVENMQIRADVLFDDPSRSIYWPAQIEQAIEYAHQVGNDYYHFAADICHIRNLKAKVFAPKLTNHFYDQLNAPFNKWLAGLTNDDERSVKVNAWKQKLQKIAIKSASELMQSSTPRDMRGLMVDRNGKKQVLNIFTAMGWLRYNVQTSLYSSTKRKG